MDALELPRGGDNRTSFLQLTAHHFFIIFFIERTLAESTPYNRVLILQRFDEMKYSQPILR